MLWTFLQLRGFNALWRQERLRDEDLQALEQLILRDPAGAPTMKGTGGLRKVRFAPPSWNRGKRGAMRVAYAQFPEYRRIYLVTLFLKSNQENLTAADRHEIKAILDRIAAALSKGENP
jgi:hypothetical protein